MDRRSDMEGSRVAKKWPSHNARVRMDLRHDNPRTPVQWLRGQEQTCEHMSLSHVRRPHRNCSALSLHTVAEDRVVLRDRQDESPWKSWRRRCKRSATGDTDSLRALLLGAPVSVRPFSGLVGRYTTDRPNAVSPGGGDPKGSFRSSWPGA
jgi:hypothetical protein